jgi:hypothetical protein
MSYGRGAMHDLESVYGREDFTERKEKSEKDKKAALITWGVFNGIFLLVAIWCAIQGNDTALGMVLPMLFFTGLLADMD